MKPSTYWRTLLAASVLISTAGNTGHTLLVGGDHSWAAACWAAVPPLMIFAVTHGHASSAGAGVRLWVYRAGVTGAVLIAAGAFWASYVALRDLSLMLGQPRPVAIVMPLIVDLAIAVASTLALAVRPDVSVHQPAHQPAVPVPAAAPAPVPSPAAPAADASAVASGDAATMLHLVQGDAGDAAADAVMHQARLLVHQGVTRLDVGIVADVLARSAAGASQRSIGRALNVDPRTVASILEAAEQEGTG